MPIKKFQKEIIKQILAQLFKKNRFHKYNKSF